MAKNYKSFTGLEGFMYQVDGEDTINNVVEPIEYLQEVSVATEQSIEKAYGDNVVAELAVSNGTTEVQSTFHKLPLEDRAILFGLKVVDGIVGQGIPQAPYVNVMFTKTMENGAKEYVGLKRGLFTIPESSNSTKKDSVEFSSDQSTAEFMGSHSELMNEHMVVLLGEDKKGETAARDAIYLDIFGVNHPDSTTDTATEPVPEA
ncbi:major tail protein [Abyssicoccus albus]|uniref:major tail protein n=1 Tax=Abyssicoccus albus TaxID=1817405 RepID=UPI00097E30C0|nr:major tail protein [Abyssicoccus albus]AQL56416.1 phage tail protein [Abyssicoccus albus]